ncbi:MAG: PucR family transcriptional regulator ligand-binding domain-containing protein [Actinobacteria bacterium]|nr:PucR family transcriptional regulator ligand-binding domain-containing protein [Actinomycetota bacterium]
MICTTDGGPVPDLTELCAALGADLVPVPGSAPASVPVTAVHVSELTDPTPFLEGGELLLTTGMALRPPAPDVTAYVARLGWRPSP